MINGNPAPNTASNRLRVFISYSRKDIDAVKRLHENLIALGFAPFRDQTDIKPGEDWQARLSGLIAGADSVVFVLSPDSASSNICQWEMRECARLGKRVLPLVVREVAPTAVPPELAKLNWTFARSDDEYTSAMPKLAEALSSDFDWVREHTRIGDLAQRWDAGGRTNSRLLRGGDLEAAEAWLAQSPREAALPTLLQGQFIQTSRKSATARQRNWIGGLITAAVFSLGLAGFALISRDQAVKAQAEAVAQRNVATKAQKEAEAQRNAAVAAQKLADQQRRLADAARNRAETTLTAATATAQGLVDNIVQREKDVQGAQVSVLRDILARASTLLTKLANANGMTPAIQATQASALAGLAIREIGPQQAEDLASANDKAQALVRQQPNSATNQLVLGKAATARGETLYVQHNYPPALAAQRQGRDAFKQCFTLDATNGTCLNNEANSEGWIGTILAAEHDYTGALSRFDTALKLYNELLAKWPDQKPLVDKMGAAIAINKAAAYQNIGSLNQALVTYQQALPTMIALARSPNARQSDMRALANVYNSLGATLSIQLAQGKHLNRATRIQKAKQVLDYLAGAWALSEHLAKADPSNGLESANLVAVQKNLQTACLNMGLSGDPNACLNRAGIRIAPLP